MHDPAHPSPVSISSSLLFVVVVEAAKEAGSQLAVIVAAMAFHFDAG